MVGLEQTTKRAGRVQERGQALVLVIIVLAIFGGGYWYLTSSRRSTEKEAWGFAREVAEHIALKHDEHFVDLSLSPRAQVAYPPSWRSRLFENIRDLGTPDDRIVLTGRVEFASYFFEPKGIFRAQINFPGMPAYLDIEVTANGGPWQIDGLNMTWSPPRNDW